MGVCSGTVNFIAAGIGKGNILVTIVGLGVGGSGDQRPNVSLTKYMK